MSKAPAFQLYAADFYMDTVSWSATQVGLYFRLLMYEWVNGPLPEDINSLARIAGLDPGNFKKCYLQDIAKKFTPDPHGGIVNLRLERTREEQLKWHETQRKRINKRWGNDDTTVLPGNIPEGIPDRYSSSSSSSSSQGKDLKAEEPPVDNPPPFESVMTPKEPVEPKPEPQNTHGERWDEEQTEKLNELMNDISQRYGMRYHGKVLAWVRDNLNRKNPDAMLYCLRRLINDRMAGRQITMPERWLEAALNGNGKHPGENGRFEAEETQREAAARSGPVSERTRALVAGIGGAHG